MIQGLDASEVEVGVVRAAQFLPYLLVGLVAGALVDRWRRRPTLLVTQLAQGLVLLLLPLLWWNDLLTVPLLAGVLLVAGGFAVFAAAAEQSILPDLVPRGELVPANARLGQSMTVTQSAGPPLTGALIAWLGLGAGLVAGGLSRVVAGLLVARVAVEEHRPEHPAPLTLRRDIVTGVRFTYRHPTLTPLAVSTHTWFLANSVAMTVLGLFALRELGLSATQYGVVLAAVGVGGFVGAVCAPAVGRRIGEGDAIVLGRLLCTLAWAALCLVPEGDPVPTLVLVAATQLLYGLAQGIEDPNDMGYWQASTPRDLLGRVNATRRSANRSVAVVGALLGGVVAAGIGYRGTLLAATLVFLAATLVAALSPVRGARASDPRLPR